MSGETRNFVRLDAGGAVVQAGSVTGGLHLHQRATGAPAVPRQLPLPPRWMVARDRELDLLSDVFDQGSGAAKSVLVTVESGGGMGKTALALFWAHREAARFPDGQLFADLGGVDPAGPPASASSVLHGFLISLGVDPVVISNDLQAAAGLYRSVLAGKRILVVLDNARDAAQVLPLLPGGGSGGTIVTSRRQLPALAMRGAVRLALDPLPRAGAHALLARHIGEPVRAEPGAADRLVDCCAGLPLALAIVAARSSSHPDFPLSVLVSELEEASGLSGFDAGDDYSSLRVVLSWSVAGLDDNQAAALRLLGAASVTEIGLDAASSLLALPKHRAAQVLRALETRNLLRQDRPGRFRMHELVGRHAAELSNDMDTASFRSAALLRMVDFYLHTARTADRLLYPHRTPVAASEPEAGSCPLDLADENAALEWFTEQYPQILAAQRTAMRLGWPARAWQLTRAVDTYMYRCGRLQDNVDSSRLGAVAADLLGDEEVRALAYRQLGRACTRAGHFAEAESALNLALFLTRRAGDLPGEAHTLHDLTRLHAFQGHAEEALRAAESAMNLYRAAGNLVGEAHALNAQGRQHAVLGDHEQARRCCETALTLHEANGNPSGQLATLENLGYIAGQAGRHQEAAERYAAALDLCRGQRNSFVEPGLLEHLAGAYLAQDRPAAGLVALRQALEHYEVQHRGLESERVLRRIAEVEHGAAGRCDG